MIKIITQISILFLLLLSCSNQSNKLLEAVKNSKLIDTDRAIYRGADVNTVNTQTGESLLDVAESFGDWEIWELLIKHGAKE